MANLSKVFSAELDGIEAKVIEVETDINVGLHAFNIVGLADKALSEAKERVNSALKNSGVKPPNKENRKIVVNLAPADIKKTGSQYDVAIAIAYLVATGQIKDFPAQRMLLVGELALDGRLRSINGALSIAHLARTRGYADLYVPKENAVEAALVPGVHVIPVSTLTELIEHLEGRRTIAPQTKTTIGNTVSPAAGHVDIAEIKGQAHAKRALTIAAAGGHNLLMTGSPGAGKTMLARALASVLPPLSLGEVLEVTRIYSAAGMLGSKPFMGARPFRAPHHTASPIAVVGGGQVPRPGEMSLAHRGILFLDELPEFRRDLLESLRQPLESGSVHISRVRGNLEFPAQFSLVTAMNPCPCGYYGDEEKECKCSANEVFRYQKKISGPLLDRIDIQIEVPRVEIDELRKREVDYREGDAVREKVFAAREMQKKRFEGTAMLTNADMNSKECDARIALDPDAEAFIKPLFEKSLVSARGFYRTLKVAQTIADLEGALVVRQPHLAEAFSYRLREEA